MSTKQVMRDAERWRKARINEYVMYFSGLLHNSISIEGLPDDVPKRYFLRVLFKHGKIGYGNGVYLPVYGTGVDIYGLPTEYVYTAYNGIVFNKSAKDAKILRLNDQSYPIIPYLKQQAELLTDIDTSIRQNLYSIRTQAVYECKDQATLLSIQNLIKSRAIGAEVVVATKSAMENDKLTVHTTGAQYFGADLSELRKEFLDETLGRLGIMYANTNKKERVQAAEVNASVGGVIDNVYVMIDTFNYDAKIAGLPLKMKLNSVTEDYYALTENTNVNNNSNKEEQNAD